MTNDAVKFMQRGFYLSFKKCTMVVCKLEDKFALDLSTNIKGFLFFEGCTKETLVLSNVVYHFR